MGECGLGDALDVVGRDVRPPREHGPGAGRLEQPLGATRRDADVDAGVPTRGTGDLGDVLEQVVVDADRLGHRPQGEHVVVVDHLAHRRHLCVTGGPAFEQRYLPVHLRVADAGLYHEPVDLGLRQRESALLLDGILRGDDEKRLWQVVRLAVDSHLLLGHRLEQRRLGLRRRAVDLVRENDVREHRALVELERAVTLVEHVRPGDVGRQQVRRELDTTERQPQCSGETLCSQGLARSGHVLKENVALSEYARHDHLEEVSVGDHRGAYFVDDRRTRLTRLLDLRLHVLTPGGLRFRTVADSRRTP